MQFPRPVHTNRELQFDVPGTARASDERYTTGERLLYISTRLLHKQEIVGQGSKDLRRPCHGHMHGWEE